MGLLIFFEFNHFLVKSLLLTLVYNNLCAIYLFANLIFMLKPYMLKLIFILLVVWYLMVNYKLCVLCLFFYHIIDVLTNLPSTTHFHLL